MAQGVGQELKVSFWLTVLELNEPSALLMVSAGWS